MQWDYDHIYSVLTKAGIAVTTALPIWLRLRKIVRSTREAFGAAKLLADTFGPESAKVIAKAMAQMRHSHAHVDARMEMALAEAGIGIYTCDSNAKCVSVSRTLTRIYGVTESDMLGFGWLEFIVPEDREPTRQAWLLAVKENLPYVATYRILRGSEQITIETRAVRLYDGTWVGSCKEVSYEPI